MSAPEDWARAFARQAQADFAAWEAMQDADQVAPCCKLVHLQMACEKLCKAHLIQAGSDAMKLQGSHGYVASQLPVIVRQQLIKRNTSVAATQSNLRSARQLAQEIELLSPQQDRGGQRPDNCEYPWEDGTGRVLSPLDWSFPSVNLLLLPNGRNFLRLIRHAIDDLVEELQ